MKHQELLKKLRAAALALIARADEIMEARSKREDSAATEEEARELAEIKAKLDKMQIDIADTEAMARREIAAATVVTSDPLAVVPKASDVPRIEVHLPKPEKGIAFARYAIAMIRNKNDVRGALATAVQYRNQWGNTPEVEAQLRAAVDAGTVADADWAAPLAYPTNITGEFIDLVRAETIIGKLNGVRKVPFNVRIPRKLTGGTAAWVGEGLSKPVGELSFDSVTVPLAKMAGICVFTNELMRVSNPSIEALVRDDLKETIIALADATFIDNTAASAVRPAGMQQIIPAGNKDDSTGSTVAQITADLSAAISRATAGGQKLVNPYWIMSPRTAAYLGLVRTTQDVFAFRDEMVGGNLLGIPVITSSHVPTDGGTPPAAETFIMLVSAGEMYLADDGNVSLDMSNEASLQLDTEPDTPPTPLVSLWQQNMVAIKAERYMYWMARRVTPHALIEKVTY